MRSSLRYASFILVLISLVSVQSWAACSKNQDYDPKSKTCYFSVLCGLGSVFDTNTSKCISPKDCKGSGDVLFEGQCISKYDLSITLCAEHETFFVSSGKCRPSQRDLDQNLDPYETCDEKFRFKDIYFVENTLNEATKRKKRPGAFIRLTEEKMKACNIQFSELSEYTRNGNKSLREVREKEIARLNKEFLVKNNEEKLTLPYVKETEQELVDLGADHKDLESFKSIKQKLSQADRDSCLPEVDMREKMGPIRDQDGTGYCYAYAAANILTYELGTRISALDLAAVYGKKDDESFKVKSGGLSEIAISRSIAKGFCLESKFSDENMGNDRSLSSRLNELEKKNWVRPYDIEDLKRKYGFPNYEKADNYCKPNSVLTAFFPQSNANSLIESLNYVQHDQAQQIMDKACAPRIKPKSNILLQEIIFDENNNAAQIAELDRLITDKKPSVISVSRFKQNPYSKEIARHAMTLAGRRWNSKTYQCEFIIRNSWGKSCGFQPKEFVCEDGELYVTRADLAKFITNANYIR